MSTAPELSIVIPVYNEELNLPMLFTRLYPALDGLGRSYEIIFTNDGSADRSMELLRAQFARRPDVTRVIDFNTNYGQHMAIMAAFERVQGQIVVTLDADLQNPPEEIGQLLIQMDAGHDYVGGYRLSRQDSLFRTYASKVINFVREKTTNIEMTDHGHANAQDANGHHYLDDGEGGVPRRLRGSAPANLLRKTHTLNASNGKMARTCFPTLLLQNSAGARAQPDKFVLRILRSDQYRSLLS